MMIKRRDFIKLATSAPVVSSCQFSESVPDESHFKSQILLPRNPDASEDLGSRSRKILVVGGGIAGLTAAYELLKRGYQVHIREADRFFGGRLHTRKERLSTGEFDIEHGLHMWFYQYYNFKRILSELNLLDNFVPFNEIYFHFKSYKPEVIKSEGPYPVNLISMIKKSPNLNLLDAVQTWRALPDIMFYNHFTTPGKIDHKTFPDWAKETGVAKRFYDIVLYPAASVTLNDPETMSAAEMALMTHFYFISHPKAFNRFVTKMDHGTAVIDPWLSKLKELGCELSLNSPVQQIDFLENGLVADGRSYDRVILACDVPGVKKLLGSAKASASLTPSLAKVKGNILGLKVAPPYHILRIWFDKPVGTDRPPEQAVIETPESKPINLIAFMHKLETQSENWATENNGAIVEFHLYNTPSFVGMSSKMIWESIRSLAETILPELIGANDLDISLGSYENFTSFAAGQGAIRPESYTARKLGLKSLLFAGDWVDYKEFPNSLMERSVTTSIDAVNTILLEDGVRQIPIEGANPRGPGLIPRF